MTEEQAYEVLVEYPDFELRRYPDHAVAETEVGGPFELAGNLAFPRVSRSRQNTRNSVGVLRDVMWP